jgi:hypothetical protein
VSKTKQILIIKKMIYKINAKALYSLSYLRGFILAFGKRGTNPDREHLTYNLCHFTDSFLTIAENDRQYECMSLSMND